MLLGEAPFGKSLHLRIRDAKERQMRLATFDTSPSLWHLISQSAAEKYFKNRWDYDNSGSIFFEGLIWTY